MKSLLEITDLQMNVGAFTLGELSLMLAPGDYLVLLGPSGCGKTTLLKVIAGVYRVGAGKLYLDERDVGRLPPQKRRVGYLSQTMDLFPHMNVARNVAFGLRYLDMTAEAKRQRFDRIVDLLGVRRFLSRAPTTLSGGESKRIALARSLVVNPRILLLDEPLNVLDHNTRLEFYDILRMIHDELGTATIHVTHDRNEAWGIGGHCAVMREGRIEQVGSVNQLFREPATRFVAEFLGDSNVFPARFEERDGTWFAILDWAELELAEPPAARDGYLQIRADNLIPASRSGTGTVRGTVRSIADRGIYSEISVQVAGGPTLRVHLLTATRANLRIGDMMELSCATPPHAIRGNGDGRNG